MQKKLIAVAVAGLVSGAAFAQSNVTIYGVMDATYDNVSATGCTSDAAGVCHRSAIYPSLGTTSGNLSSRGRTTFNSSYIGFKGSESLGNGLTAVFQIETGVGESATGSFGGTNSYGWANRDTMVALAGGFGTLAFGNLTGPTRLLGSVMDPNAGDTGIGSNDALLGKLGGGSGAGYFDQRIANAIAYISPTFSGFYGVIGYQPNENRGNDATGSASSSTVVNQSAWTFGGVYGNGPILAGVTYTAVHDANANSNSSGFLPATAIASVTPVKDFDNFRAAFKYDFGMATVGLMYDYTKATVPLGAVLAEQKAHQAVWYIPVTVKLGEGKLVGQYGWANNIKGSLIDTLDANHLCNQGESCDTKAKHFEIGYEYNLSKRTMVKALYSEIKNNKDASYDFLYGVSNPNSTATAFGLPYGADPKGISVGLRHSF